jgi:nicotinamidase-related amidase
VTTRPNTALLVVDVLNGVVEGAYERDAVVANAGRRVEKALRSRARRAPLAPDRLDAQIEEVVSKTP